MLIVTGGMIGAGKTTVAKLLGQHFSSDVMYESVEGNHILPLFYTASPEEQAAKRYPFLLQLEFLNSRFRDIKRAMLSSGTTVLDRSIYEDWYFAKVNRDMGRIAPEEFRIYEDLLGNMMEEIKELPKKSPDLFIYLHAPFDFIMDRIASRGRDFEQDDALVSYYWRLWRGYEDWVDNFYTASEVLKLNMTKYDFMKSEEDRKKLFKIVDDRLMRTDGLLADQAG